MLVRAGRNGKRKLKEKKKNFGALLRRRVADESDFPFARSGYNLEMRIRAVFLRKEGLES